MASEHDLEFVDLEHYGVDPAAGEILPVDLARRHNMVAIKRKFGTPVIATADPDDLYAQDSVRAAIGRDFISVVASPEQIGAYIDRLFGPEPGLANAVDLAEAAPPDEAQLSGKRESNVEVNGADGDTSDEVRSDDLGAALEDGSPADIDVAEGPAMEESDTPVSATRESATQDSATQDSAIPDPTTDGSVTEGPALAVSGADDPMAKVPAPEEPAPTVSGKGRRGKEDRKRKKPTIAAETDALDASDWQDFVVDPLLVEAAPQPAAADVSPAIEGHTDESDSSRQPTPTFEEMNGRSVSSAENTAPAAAEASESLEPATSVLPSFGSDWADGSAAVAFGSQSTTDPLTASVDQLAELARSLQAEQPTFTGDEAVIAADLVDEAVATYQEQLGEEQRFETEETEASGGLAMFPPLAKALVEGERVSLEEMESVLEEHYATGQSIARILTAQKLVTEADLMWGMAQEMGLEFVDLDTFGIDLGEAGTIPEATARHHNVMVIGNDDGMPVVAASNPTDVFAMDDLRTIMGRSFTVVVATRSQISAYIGRAFNSGGDAADMAMEASLGIEGSQTNGVDDIQAVTEEAPIVRYVNLLILQALNERASDIHIEPTAVELRIRYRIDGVLHDVSTAPRTIASAVTTRLKVMADMNIAEHRVPQDGRISLNVGSKGIDLRMATLPTIYGEKIVMRVLDKSSVVLGFADLGFEDDLLRTYEGLYTKPYGTILVTGPTGSGKSTTLYTTLTALNSPEKNIITVEDPVELPLKGVNQVQLNIKAGLNFAAALRAILRSDPDIVLVGEIRDKETAVISIEAALTGHMVLSTLHTNSAASTPMRLIEMGLEPFLVTSAVSGVLAQRLARRLCVHCKEAFEPTEADITSSGWRLEEVEAMGGMPKVFKAVGCSACSNTGYRGRKALAELLPMTEEIERVIIEGGSVEDIHKVAVAQGMSTLRQSGLRKAIEGETTLEEVLRVVA
jgi:type IV pilus assembly protein PilB